MYSDRRRSARRRAPRGERGLSIIDALAATAVVGAALLLLGANTVVMARSTKTADAAAAATGLAREQIERLRSMPLGAPGHNPGTFNDPGNPMNADGTPGGIFGRSWQVSASNIPAPGLRTAQVFVTWTDGSGPHTVQLAAYLRCATVPCS